MDEARQSAENVAAEEWYEGGDGHGYRYQYIGPIHYLCECGDAFLNRDRWIAHKAVAAAAPLIRRAINDPGSFVKRGPDYDGEPYGERLDQWQARAIRVAQNRAVDALPTRPIPSDATR